MRELTVSHARRPLKDLPLRVRRAIKANGQYTRYVLLEVKAHKLARKWLRKVKYYNRVLNPVQS